MISVDTLDDNKAFAAKEHADFPMLADPEKKVAVAYGVIPPDAPPEPPVRPAAGRSTSIPPAKSRAIDKDVKPRLRTGHRPRSSRSSSSLSADPMEPMTTIGVNPTPPLDGLPPFDGDELIVVIDAV